MAKLRGQFDLSDGRIVYHEFVETVTPATWDDPEEIDVSGNYYWIEDESGKHEVDWNDLPEEARTFLESAAAAAIYDDVEEDYDE